MSRSDDSGLIYKQIFEGSPDAILILNKQGVILECNGRTPEIIGYTKEDLLGQRFTNVYPLDNTTKDNFLRLFSQIIEGTAPQPIEIEITTKENNLEWVKIYSHILDKKDPDFKIQINIRKITERKKSEFKLINENQDYLFLLDVSSRLSEMHKEEEVFEFIGKQLLKIVQHSYIIISRTNRDASQMEIVKLLGIDNTILPGIYNMLGYNVVNKKFHLNASFRQKYLKPTLQKIEGKFVELTDSELPAFLAKSIEKILNIQDIYTICIADAGTYFGYIHFFATRNNLNLNSSLIESFMYSCYLALSRITFLGELEESESKYRLLANNVRDVIFTLDMDLNYTYVSPSIKSLRGYDPIKLIGKSITNTLSDDAVALIKNTFHEEYAKTKNIGSVPLDEKLFEVEMLKNDGSKVWTEVKASFIFDDNNIPVGILGVTREISERKQAEFELLKKNNALNEANIQKDKLFSIIAHDLKGPFSTILNFTALLDENYDLYDENKRRLFIQLINKSTRQTYLLLENLLDWSRSKRGKFEFYPQKLNLELVILDIIELLGNSALSKQIEIKQSVPSNLELMADEYMLKTVFRNLIGNAIKFTSNQGLITIKAGLTGDKVQISVTDNGTGIEKQDIDQLFSDHPINSKPGTEGEQGTGLGLMLCKDFIDKHGGKIWVESTVGKGSSFIFTLPASILT